MERPKIDSRMKDRLGRTITGMRMRAWRAALATIGMLLFATSARDAAAGVIFVTAVEPGASGCSLRGAIHAANNDASVASVFDPFTHRFELVNTPCVAGSGADVIVLPPRAVISFSRALDEEFNPTGPTALPMIQSDVTIEAHGSTLERTGSANMRAFVVASGGRLTLKNAVIRGFGVKGGDGIAGGGGGLGAGGAIFVRAGELIVEGCTFQGNIAIGGRGGFGIQVTDPFDGTWFARAGGGGGGLGGNAGPSGRYDCAIDDGSGGGGGGAHSGGTHAGPCGPGGGGGGPGGGNLPGPGRC